MNGIKAFALAGIIAVVGVLLVGLQEYRIRAERAEAATTLANETAAKDRETKSKDDAVAANLVSQATISTLQQELERNKNYAADLAKRISASEAKAKKAVSDYEKLKRNSKPVRDWSAQPLPDGLRGKPAKSLGGDKDNRATP